MAGYGREVFNFRQYVTYLWTSSSFVADGSFSQYWLWCGVLAPILGGLVATFVYDAFLFTGQESIFNKA